MASLATTTIPEIRALFATKMLTVVPTAVYLQSQVWSRYKRASNSPTRNRMFRFVFGPGAYSEGGFITKRSMETKCVLRVRVDYICDHERVADLVQSDWHQLREKLHELTADPANGIVSIHEDGSPSTVADSNQGRSRLSNAAPSSSDANQFDLPYTVRYNRSRAA